MQCKRIKLGEYINQHWGGKKKTAKCNKCNKYFPNKLWNMNTRGKIDCLLMKLERMISEHWSWVTSPIHFGNEAVTSLDMSSDS